MEDLGVEVLAPGSPEALDSEYMKWRLLCGEAAGTAWGPGNRPDEVVVLNQQATATTECVRDKGWDYPDPVLEVWGRFYRFDATAIEGLIPDDPEESARFITDLRTCVDTNAVDWEAWVEEHPRN